MQPKELEGGASKSSNPTDIIPTHLDPSIQAPS
jgi:hypothetical protein